jgi:superfamily I DNA/RNA helicase
MEFTKAQATAIGTVDRNLLIVACAGSGKTEVISRRISELLDQPGVEPKHIVAFTFTEKAAGELKERVHARIKAQHGSDVHGLVVGWPRAFQPGAPTEPCVTISRYTALVALVLVPAGGVQVQ